MRSQTSPISVRLYQRGSFQENTLRANIVELQATLLRQRVMVDESHLKLSIQLWDQAMSLPVVLGPVGMAGMYSSRGEVKAANAAKAVGVPFTLSTMEVCDVHEVAQKILTGCSDVNRATPDLLLRD